MLKLKCLFLISSLRIPQGSIILSSVLDHGSKNKWGFPGRDLLGLKVLLMEKAMYVSDKMVRILTIHPLKMLFH